MKTYTITSTYQGTKKLGYETGKSYKLSVSYQAINSYTIKRQEDSTGARRYQSIEAFRQDWPDGELEEQAF